MYKEEKIFNNNIKSLTHSYFKKEYKKKSAQIAKKINHNKAITKEDWCKVIKLHFKWKRNQR
jgi:hypothetical protein